MAIDYELLFKNMLAAASGSLKTDAPKVQAYLQQVMQNHKDVLVQLAKDRISGKISDADLQAELGDEKEALQAEMEGAEVIAEKAAQDAVNAAVGVLTAAIKAAVP